nr:unnamed protein product [Digitaria exilis]
MTNPSIVGEVLAGIYITEMSLEPSSSAPVEEVGARCWEAREEAAARLEAMAAAALVDDELPEEQLQGNSRIQEDELLALQAIYGDDMLVFDNMGGLRFFQISLHYQLQGDIQLYMNVWTNETTETGDEDDDEDANDGLLYACSLQHLPPITLTCLLPRSYPSTRAPHFVIVAKWLDEPEVSRFCSVLDEIWAELPGQEVVYRWADWLSGSSWFCIASDGQVVLGPDASSAARADERAIGRSLILDSTIPLMQRYSEERSQETFDQSVHECGVCFCENTGADLLSSLFLEPIGDRPVSTEICSEISPCSFDIVAGRNFIHLPCNHPFCIKCMEAYCSIHVKEGSVATLACPDTSCRAPLPPQVLRRLLADEGYERWEWLALRRTLDTMPDVAYCPRCSAACVAAGDDAQCPACFFTFCARCGDRRHVGDACVPTLDKLEDLLEQQKLEVSAKGQRKLEELLGLREVLRSTRQCPSCRMAIVKTAGCNKMVCGNCGQFFCYRCGRGINGYGHFFNGGCGLFERVGMGRDGQLDEEVERFMRAVRYTCPDCGAKRTKAGANNLLTCQRCQARY